MMNAIRHRLSRDEGFTLIELMVVVMIIAVLIAIAIPSFLGFRESAQDRGAQSELRSVLLAEKAFWLDNGAFTETEADITALEPNAEIAAAAADGVALNLAVGDQAVCMSRTSAAGNNFTIWESATEGTQYGTTDYTAGVCPVAEADLAADFAPVAGDAW
jgi:type IV pilus assembly protein PilA